MSCKEIAKLRSARNKNKTTKTLKVFMSDFNNTIISTYIWDKNCGHAD